MKKCVILVLLLALAVLALFALLYYTPGAKPSPSAAPASPQASGTSANTSTSAGNSATTPGRRANAGEETRSLAPNISPATVIPPPALRQPTPPPPVVVPIQDRATIDFSYGAPHVRSGGEDKAIIDRAEKEMAEALKEVSFGPSSPTTGDAKKAEPVPPQSLPPKN